MFISLRSFASECRQSSEGLKARARPLRVRIPPPVQTGSGSKGRRASRDISALAGSPSDSREFSPWRGRGHAFPRATARESRRGELVLVLLAEAFARVVGVRGFPALHDVDQIRVGLVR